MKLNRNGFSIVELLGVIVVLGILLTVSVSAYTRYRKKAMNEAYEVMSKSASNAAEEYFMDYPGETKVSIKDLVDGDYLDTAQDPRKKEEQCTGDVTLLETTEGVGNALDLSTYKVNVKCYKYDNCKIYSSGEEPRYQCDSEGGISTNGNNQYFNLGYENYDFQNNITMIVKVKFNEFTAANSYQPVFGNWDNAGGGISVNKNNQFYSEFYVDGHDYQRFETIEAISLNKWYIIATTVSNGTMKLYINGDEQYDMNAATSTTEKILPGNIKVSTVPFLIGANPAGSFTGNIDKASNISVAYAFLFSRGLTADEIRNIFSNPNLLNTEYLNKEGLIEERIFE